MGRGRGGGRGDKAAPLCACSQPSALKHVVRATPNKGRAYFRCQAPQGGCGFFQWADGGKGWGSGGKEYEWLRVGANSVVVSDFGFCADHLMQVTSWLFLF